MNRAVYSSRAKQPVSPGQPSGIENLYRRSIITIKAWNPIIVDRVKDFFFIPPCWSGVLCPRLARYDALQDRISNNFERGFDKWIRFYNVQRLSLVELPILISDFMHSVDEMDFAICILINLLMFQTKINNVNFNFNGCIIFFYLSRSC